MSAWWLIAAFVAGAVAWHKIGFALTRHTFRHNDSLTTDILEGLSQKSLVKVYEKSLAEIERRQKGIA